MDAAATLRNVRRRSRLTQSALAARAGTSQATISAYERGIKQPSLDTFERLLAAAGARLAVEEAESPVVVPGQAQLARSGRILEGVLALAEALPARHDQELRFPRLPAGT